MLKTTFILYSAFAVLLLVPAPGFVESKKERSAFASYEVDLGKQQLQLFWKDSNGKPYKSIKNLKHVLAANGETLVFAMNGGMYKTDNSPLGLYIENYKTLVPLNKKNANGNFYLKPNGVFYFTQNNKAVICKTENFIPDPKIQYATQSGPMLVIDGQIHPSFTKGSSNINIRNGVGILPNNHIVFAMSKYFVNVYDFAEYFKQLGCKNALYLDGSISQTYLPESDWIETGGNFGVIIAVTKKGK